MARQRIGVVIIRTVFVRNACQGVAIDICRVNIVEIERAGDVVDTDIELGAFKPRHAGGVEIDGAGGIGAGSRSGVSFALARGALLADLEAP